MSRPTVEMKVHNRDGDTLQSATWEAKSEHVPGVGERLSLGGYGPAATVKDVLWFGDLNYVTVTSKVSMPAADFFRFIESLVTLGVITLAEYSVIQIGDADGRAEPATV